MDIDQEILDIRKDFPILKRKVRNNKSLVYLDNAATTQKPNTVINAISDYYTNYNANVHRGIHALSEEASEMYEDAHQKVADFINAQFEEIVFTKNSTESQNIVANSLLDSLKPGDEIVVSRAEHHANLVPYQQVAKKTGAILKFIELHEFTNLDVESARDVITDNCKLVAIPHMSNVLGAITPAKEIIEIAHEHGAKVLLDGAQSVPHLPVDVKKLDADFVSFSGHKMLGPMGTGVLYGKKEYLMEMSPFLYGGDMIRYVSYNDATWNDLPWKFEAGTPNVGGAVGLSAAIDYLNNLTMSKVRKIEHYLTSYAMDKLSELDFITVYGPDADNRGGVIAFNITGGDNGVFVHPHDVASILDEAGIAIRAGHHCAQPLHDLMNIPATSRMSFYIYNTIEEIDYTINILKEVNSVFN